MRFHRAYSFDAPCEQVYDLLIDEGFQRERVARTGTDPPAEVPPADPPRLLGALRPMLRTLLGPRPADAVLEGIRGSLR